MSSRITFNDLLQHAPNVQLSLIANKGHGPKELRADIRKLFPGRTLQGGALRRFRRHCMANPPSCILKEKTCKQPVITKKNPPPNCSIDLWNLINNAQTKNNIHLRQENLRLAREETTYQIFNLPFLNDSLNPYDHDKILKVIENLNSIHNTLADWISLEVTLKEIVSNHVIPMDADECQQLSGASYLLLSLNPRFRGFDLEDFNGTEDIGNEEFAIEASITTDSGEATIELKDTDLEANAEKEDGFRFQSEQKLIEIFSDLNRDEVLSFLISIYFNPLLSEGSVKHLSETLLDLTIPENENLEAEALGLLPEEELLESSSPLISALEELGGMLYQQLQELAKKRLEGSDDIELIDTDSDVILLDDEDRIDIKEQNEINDFQFELNRQGVFLTLVETNVIEPSMGQFQELYDIAIHESIRDRISLAMLDNINNRDDENFVAKVFLKDLDPDTTFPKSHGLRKQNAMHFFTKVVEEKALPILEHCLRLEQPETFEMDSKITELKCAAFDGLLDENLTGNWGEEKLKKEIIKSCKELKNPFLIGRLICLSKKSHMPNKEASTKCKTMLEDILSDDSIDFKAVLNSLENELIPIDDNIPFMITNEDPFSMIEGRQIHSYPFNRSVLRGLYGYDYFINQAYEERNNNPTYARNCLTLFEWSLPEDPSDRNGEMQILIAKNNETSKQLLELTGMPT